MSTKSFVQNVNIVADNLDVLEELNTNLPKEDIETLVAYDYSPLLADLNSPNSNVKVVSAHMGNIDEVANNIEAVVGAEDAATSAKTSATLAGQYVGQAAVHAGNASTYADNANLSALKAEDIETRLEGVEASAVLAVQKQGTSSVSAVQSQANISIGQVQSAETDAINNIKAQEPKSVTVVKAQETASINQVKIAENTSVSAVEDKFLEVDREINESKVNAVSSVEASKDGALKEIHDETIVALTSVQEASQDAVNFSEDARKSADKAEEAAAAVGRETNIVQVVRAVEEATEFYVPSEKAVAESMRITDQGVQAQIEDIMTGVDARVDARLDASFAPFEEEVNNQIATINSDMDTFEQSVNTQVSTISDSLVATQEAITDLDNIVNSQSLWKGTQEEFDALTNKDDYFLSYVLNRGTLDKIYQGSYLIFSNILKRITIQGSLVSDEKFEVISEDVSDIYNWIADNKSNLKTIKFIDPYGLFIGSPHTFQTSQSLVSIDFSEYNGYNTEYATSLQQMFSSCSSLVSLDISTFDLSNVDNMSDLLTAARSLTSVTFPSHKIIKPTIATHMLSGSSLLTTLDLSSFDFSQCYVDGIVSGCTSLTTCYGRTQADCDKLNASSSKPDNVNFIVKP